MSLHCAITTNFDEAADMSCWHYFFNTYIWFSNSMSATCSSSHKLTLVMFLILFSFSSYFWTSLVLFCLIALGFISLLALPYAALLPICLFSFLAEFDNFTSAFSVSCTDQCKVSIKDNGHVILHMVVLTAQITDHCF